MKYFCFFFGVGSSSLSLVEMAYVIAVRFRVGRLFITDIAFTVLLFKKTRSIKLQQIKCAAIAIRKLTIKICINKTPIKTWIREDEHEVKEQMQREFNDLKMSSADHMSDGAIVWMKRHSFVPIDKHQFELIQLQATVTKIILESFKNKIQLILKIICIFSTFNSHI